MFHKEGNNRMQQFIVYTGKTRLLNKNSLRYGRDDINLEGNAPT
jgi:hypothetical protein